MITDNRNVRLLFAAQLYLSLLASTLLAGSPWQPPEQHSAYLPASTIAALSIRDSKRWMADWKSTGIAQYFAEPAIGELAGKVAAAAEKDNPWLTFVQRHSISEFIDGQATIAIVESGNAMALVVILDVGDSNRLSEFVSELRSDLQQRRAIVGEVSHNGLKLQTITMPGERRNTLAYFNDDDRIFASSNLNALKQLVTTGENSLLQSPEFDATVQKVVADVDQPEFWWFFNPLEILKRARSPELEPDSALSENYRIAMAEGFSAVRAVGGIGSLKRGLSPFLVGQVLAQRPFERGMRLLELQDLETARFPDWAAGSSTSLGYLNLRMETLLNSFSTLFDTVAGEGEEGVFEAVLQDLESDPNGPKVDIRNEVIAELKTPLLFATVATKITTQTIIGVETRNSKKLASAVDRLFAGDSRAKRVTGLEYDAWQVLPLENNPAGIRKPFVMAVRENFLLFAADIDVINSAFDAVGKSARNMFLKPLDVDPAVTGFGYAADLNALARLRHEQLRLSGSPGGMIGTLVARLELGESLQQADRSRVPDFESVSKFFTSRLCLRVTSNANGWSIVVRYED